MEQKDFNFQTQVEKKEDRAILTEAERMAGEHFYRVELTTSSGEFVPPYKCGADDLAKAVEKANQDGANSRFIVGEATEITENELKRLNGDFEKRFED